MISMNNKICFATGNLWSTPHEQEGELLKTVRKLKGIDGVELTLMTSEDVTSFSASKADERWMKGCRMTMHAPCGFVAGPELLDLLSSLYKRLNCEAIVFHPLDAPAPDVLQSYDFYPIAENLPMKYGFTINDLNSFFRRYAACEFGFCLDTAHAHNRGAREAEALLREFGDRLTQLHFSGHAAVDHVRIGDSLLSFLDDIGAVFSVGVPVVIEEGAFGADAPLGDVQAEIDYIRGLWHN